MFIYKFEYFPSNNSNAFKSKLLLLNKNNYETVSYIIDVIVLNKLNSEILKNEYNNLFSVCAIIK